MRKRLIPSAAVPPRTTPPLPRARPRADVVDLWEHKQQRAIAHSLECLRLAGLDFESGALTGAFLVFRKLDGSYHSLPMGDCRDNPERMFTAAELLRREALCEITGERQ